MTRKSGPAGQLRVHLRWDGGIYITRTNGKSGFVSEAILREELAAARQAGCRVLYSREQSDREPPPWVANTFRLIASHNLSITVVETPPPSLTPEDSSREPRTFMAAAYTGNTEWTSELVRRGLPVDEPDEDGQTALMYAANAGHADIIRVLLAAGADVNARDVHGNTPLMFAAQHGHRLAVEALVASGADLSAHGSHGLTAHDLAVQNGHRNVLRQLSGALPPDV